MNSASLCSLAGRYENLIPPRCLAPIDFVVPARQAFKPGGIGSLESILELLKNLKIRDPYQKGIYTNVESCSY